MKTMLLVAAALSLLCSAATAAAQGLPWKQASVETEIHSGLPVPGAQTTVRYLSPSDLDAHHELTAYLGPRFSFDRDTADVWILPQVGFKALIAPDRSHWHPQLVASIWGKFSLMQGALSYEIKADACAGVHFTQAPYFDAHHNLDYNFFVLTPDGRAKWAGDLMAHLNDPYGRYRRSQEKGDPRVYDHFWLQAGVHARERNQYFDFGPAVGASYHGLSVSFEYLLGLQDANRGQSLVASVGADLFM